MISNSLELDATLLNDVRAVKLRLMDLMEQFEGDPTKPQRNEPAAPGISRRVRTMMFGAMGSTEGPTGTHKRQYEIALKQFQKASKELEKIVNIEIPRLNKKLDAANASWTPGRKIPRVK